MEDALLGFVESYGYVAVFLLVGLESLGVPLPGETALLTAAAFAASGRLSITLVVLLASAGAILGDNGGYWIGRKGGIGLVRRYGRKLHLDAAKLDAAHRFFERHGAKTIFFGRFIAILRTWAAMAAGISSMDYRTFTIYNAVGGVTWSVVFGTLGYVFGENMPALERTLGRAGLIAIIVASLAIALYIGKRIFAAHVR